MAEPSVQVCKFRVSLDCAAGRQTRADCYICPSLKAELQKIEILVKQESEARQALRKAEARIRELEDRLRQLERIMACE